MTQTAEAGRSGPTCLIGGAQKAGTTSLFFLLDEHPSVFAPTIKEPTYFAFQDGTPDWSGPGADMFSRYLISDQASYEGLFASGSSFPHRLEASTMYLSEPGVPEAIAAHDPAIKVVFVLRDPAERAYSAFNYLRLRGLEPLASILEAVEAEPERAAAGWAPSFEYLRLSRYGDHLKRFLDVLPESQIRCLSYEQVVSDPLAALRELERFLGLEPFSGYTLGVRHNPSGQPRFARLQDLLDFRAPGLRGRLRKVAPRPVHRAAVAVRNWNLSRPPGLTDDERLELVGRLRPQIELVREIVGAEMTAGWDRLERSP